MELFVTLRQIAAAGKSVILSNSIANTGPLCKIWSRTSVQILGEVLVNHHGLAAHRARSSAGVLSLCSCALFPKDSEILLTIVILEIGSSLTFEAMVGYADLREIQDIGLQAR